MLPFFSQDYGAVLGIGINKYVYVLANERFESNVRVSYSKTEIVDTSTEIEHDLIRESLLRLGINNKIEVVTVADVPGTGTGLGSSSSTLVGLLNSLSYYINDPLDKHELADIACDIEINKLKKPIGKQDQYFATYGGLSFFEFKSDGNVKREKVSVSEKILNELENNIFCFYTNVRLNSTEILLKQKEKTLLNRDVLIQMKEQAEEGKRVLRQGDLTKFGEMLDTNWKLKKKLSDGITNDKINLYYQKAIKSGALGGKITGAGGGGFLMIYCEEKHHNSLQSELSDLREMRIKIDKFGSMILQES